MITYYVIGCLITIMIGLAVVYFDAKSDPDADWIKNSLGVILLCWVYPIAVVLLVIAMFMWMFDEDTHLTKTIQGVANKIKPKQITDSSDSIEVINFRDLSGQELDAELTRLHKEKNGWN